MSNRSLGALLKCLVRRCDTRGSLFHGSIVDARGNESYIYSCQECGRVFSSAKSPFGKEFSFIRLVSIPGEGTKIMFQCTDTNDFLGVSEFIEGIKSGNILFTRNHLKNVFLEVEDNLNVLSNQVLIYSKEKSRLTNLLSRKEEIISGLLSATENVPTLVVSDIDKDNERQISNANMLSTWLITLLNHGKVSVPIEAYRLFHLLLSVNYGYEVMRYRWEWNTVVENEEKRMVFQNRTKRRTKK